MGQSFSAEPVVEKHTETDSNEIYDAAVSSCQGWRFSQEDDHSLKLVLPGEHKAAFFAVFDGHGSAKVSKHAAESLWRHLTENDLYKKGNFKEALEQSFLSFDREVFDSYNAQLAGTTATSVLIVDNVIYCANIGDSRSVASINCKCVPLSYDHKPDNPPEMKRILEAGGYVLGNRVNGNLALSRAFGDFHYKSNEQLPPDQQIVSPFPEIERIELNDDVDFIVLACDGIWDVLTSEEVVEFVISRLEHEVRPDQICEQLTTRCLATDYELVIGCDNMTVLLVCYTRGMSWSDYCTEIFNRNTKRLRLTNRNRELDSTFGNDTTTFQHPNQRNDDTLQQQNHLNSSSASDLSSEATSDSTFSHSSQDSPWSPATRMNIPPEPTALIDRLDRQAAMGRAMDELFYLLQTGRRPAGDQRESSDDTPVSQVPAEEVVTIHDDDDTSAKPSDADGSTSNDSTQKSNTTETEESDKSAGLGAGDEASVKQENDALSKVGEADENLISSGTAEINLNDGAPDGTEMPDETEITPIDLSAASASNEESGEPEVSEGTVKVELGAGDDVPDADNIQPVEIADQSNEIDEGITVEGPEEESAAPADPEPQDDSNGDS